LSLNIANYQGVDFVAWQLRSCQCVREVIEGVGQGWDKLPPVAVTLVWTTSVQGECAFKCAQEVRNLVQAGRLEWPLGTFNKMVAASGGRKRDHKARTKTLVGN
jgi:hypothetical protein